MEMMNFQSPFPALFHRQLANAMRTSYLCVHQHRCCEKRYQRRSQCQSLGFVGRGMWIKESKAWSVVSIEIVGGCSVRVFFGGEFSPPGDKEKRPGELNKGIFENLKNKSPFLEKKKVNSRQI
jgi:hypothetical protein